SDLTDTSRAEIERAQHPIFAIINETHKYGLPQCPRARALAMLNCELNNNLDWVGHMASPNGAHAPMTHFTSMEVHASEELAPLLRDTARKSIDAVNTTTGWLQTRNQSRPFQITIAANTKNLLLLADQVGFTKVTASRFVRNYLIALE